ncbi:DoxX family membrane protein [Kitasatospora sp. NBC_01287]|uniref:DoxX family membrane protein n=1 Tax=Kitasatospora sp. NBC_01287 TaxID=2903573 RepID=UPI00224D9B27|nr:DoxX family membrane protein [Kitasatospora sp. NBC_01287]MCX4748241.1 DoxX family membrane protein [Kitasatospora sp. NBC_01287]
MPSDPARLSSTQVSFRLRLAAPVAPLLDAPPPLAVPYADSFGRPYAALNYGGRPGLVRVGSADAGPAALAGVGAALGGPAAVGAPRRKGRVTAVTWSGQAAPGDLAATQLLDAVRLSTVPAPVGGAASLGSSSASSSAFGASAGGGSSVGLVDPEETQPLEAVPGWDDTPADGSYGYGGRGRGTYGTRGAVPRQPHGWADGPAPFGAEPYGSESSESRSAGPASARPRPPVEPRLERARPAGWKPSGELPEHSAAAAGESSRHSWQPRRKVDLGLVLLPLRLLLGSLSVYAGFSKLCDPVYFDGGNRGSMMRWLSSLHPWQLAQPLLDFAMAHPVGAGLGVAFTEIVVGVLSLLGLWQRLAAGAAMLLSAALLFTVSWRAVPVYDTPDLIFLAAWSPLLIAGAPFASLDGRLALEAWRRYGPQAPKAVRRRVLRRGTVVAVVVIGLTMLVGSLLGAAVRTGGRPQPGPAQPPTDYGPPVWPAATVGTGGSHAPGMPAPAPRPATGSAPPSTAPSAAPATPSAPPSAAPTAGRSAKARPSTAGRGGVPEGSATGGNPAGPGGGSPAGAPAAGATPAAGGAAPAPGGTQGSGSGASTRAPKAAPSDGLIGGVLGSGPPQLRLPTTLGMPGAGPGASGGSSSAAPMA